jgi:hypothetical protein
MPNHPEWEDSMGALIDVISLFAILSNRSPLVQGIGLAQRTVIGSDAFVVR